MHVFYHSNFTAKIMLLKQEIPNMANQIWVLNFSQKFNHFMAPYGF